MAVSFPPGEVEGARSWGGDGGAVGERDPFTPDPSLSAGLRNGRDFLTWLRFAMQEQTQLVQMQTCSCVFALEVVLGSGGGAAVRDPGR